MRHGARAYRVSAHGVARNSKSSSKPSRRGSSMLHQTAAAKYRCRCSGRWQRHDGNISVSLSRKTSLNIRQRKTAKMGVS